MATGKRYYWLKLRDSFMFSDAVDFLMSQKDGANYVVLYQMLCLKTINTGGKLERQIGEVIIPYDEAKIQRDTKWFSIDTVRVALNLYKALGLVYVDKDGCLILADHGNLVGSETDYAQKNRRIRANQQALSVGHNVSTGVSADVSENVTTDIRDRDKENRDKEKDVSSTTTCACAHESGQKQENVSTHCGDADDLCDPECGRVMSFYLDRINSMPSTSLTAELTEYTAQLSADVVLHALNIALDEHKTSWSYIRAILEHYKRDGLRTLADVQASEQAYRNQAKRQRGGQRFPPGQQRPMEERSEEEKIAAMRRMLEYREKKGAHDG